MRLVNIFFIILLLNVASANAGLFGGRDMTFALNQSDYYFLVGENAVIPLEIENDYDKNISGMFTYTISQNINQGGISYSNTNTQSKTFLTPSGDNTIAISFGTSNNPGSLTASLSFEFDEDGKKVIDLEDITIHFVSDESQKQNQQNRQEQASEEVQEQKQQSSQQSQQQQTQQQQQQDRLQNSQLNQDSNALKQQMQKQQQERQSLEQEFKQNLEQNQDYQEARKQLEEEGYKQSEQDLKPSDKDTGQFEEKYQSDNGREATLSGSMQNGTMQDMQKMTNEDQQKMMEQLQQNQEFQKMREQLQKEGFKLNKTSFSQSGNLTNMKLDYANNNQTANITATFENQNITKIEMKKNDDSRKRSINLVILLLIAGIISYLAYSKYLKMQPAIITPQVKKQKAFNYKLEAKKLLERAKKHFEKKDYKDAYGLAAQSIRTFLSYKHGLQKELTNDDIVSVLKKNRISHNKIKEGFDICSLVEFAKYTPNRRDFDKVIKIAEGVIGA